LMVGQLGDSALAAVGISSFANFFCSAFVMGISTSVQATVSRRMGEGEEGSAAVPLNGGLLIAWLVGLPLTFLLLECGPYGVPLLVSDPEVAAIATPYLKTRFCGLIPLAMAFSFRGYWNGVGLTKIYFRTIVIMHLFNALMNYVLIFGHFGAPALGATGAGLASTLALWLGSVLYAGQAFVLSRKNGFLRRLPTLSQLIRLVRLAIPTGVQQTSFAGGMMVFFAIVARVGTTELAASNVLVNLLLVVILPSIGFGLASATLVGQALGRGDLDGARDWANDVIRVALVLMVCLGLLGALAPEVLLRPFLRSAETLQVAIAPLRFIAIGLPIDAIGLILMHSMLGAGHARRMMYISVGLQWGLQLPLIYVVALVFHQNLAVIWGVYFAYRAVLTAVLFWEWRARRWQRAQV